MEIRRSKRLLVNTQKDPDPVTVTVKEAANPVSRFNSSTKRNKSTKKSYSDTSIKLIKNDRQSLKSPKFTKKETAILKNVDNSNKNIENFEASYDLKQSTISSEQKQKGLENISVVNKCQNSNKLFKRCYESDSDSSSDEFVKVPKSLLDLNNSYYKSGMDSVRDDKTNLPISENNQSTDIAITENNSSEYFDFSSLLTHVNKSHVIKDLEENNQSTPDKHSLIEGNKKIKNKVDSVDYSVSNKSNDGDQMEVFELLAKGENTSLSAKAIRQSIIQSSKENYEIPKQVEVLVDAPILKKKRCAPNLEMILRRRLNSIKKDNQVFIHKVHLLCYIGHGNYVNNLLNSAELLGIALSLLPSNKCYPSKRLNMNYLENLINWFYKKVPLKKNNESYVRTALLPSLLSQFQKCEAETKSDLCFMFICIIRALGVKCRLIINLNVLPIKPTSDQLLPINPCTTSEKSSKICETDRTKTTDNILESKVKISNRKQKYNNCKSESSKFLKDVNKTKKEDKISKKRNKLSTENNESKYFENKKNSRRSDRLKKKDDTQNEKLTPSKRKSNTKNKINITQSIEEMSSSSDSEYDEIFVSSKKIKKIDRQVLSPEEGSITEDSLKMKDTKQNKNKDTKQNKNNYWLEVYLEDEEKWISVDISKKMYCCNQQLYNNASHPVRYVLAWNNDNTVKDVTKRYTSQYLTVIRKLRVDENWWSQTLYPFKPSETPQEREEDEELDKTLEEQPLPSSISEYKNHPLYALKRHLLKFQAIYPPDAPTLGFIRGEPVYSRACVQQLHGREMWIKEAKVVKIEEKPYKIVKGRQKKDKFGNSDVSRDLELFGSWQVEDYVPPVAENGKVPRNAFGNVELFKPCMLPKGTVYLQIPGLQKIANKLNIDCAAAITGFEYSTNGWSYPVKDGFVVCEEFKDILLDAFNQELEEAEKKEKMKREERVYGNWKKLIKAVLIREKLQRKYNFADSTSDSTQSANKSK